MSALWISIVSLVLGIFSTVIVSHYYFRRNLKKISLTPFIQFSSSSLKGIDSKVRKDLQIKYNGQDIENLFEIQFLIANTGNKAIKNILEPLSLNIPNDCNLLDAHILHVSPTGRKVKLNITDDKSSIEFDFSLLNSGDFFIVKLLINGNPSDKDFNFSIVAEDLSPTLETSFLPMDAIGHINERKSFEKELLVIGIILFLIGLSLFKLVFDSWSVLPSFNDFKLFSYIFEIDTSGWAVLVSIFPAFLCILSGVMAGIGSFSDFVFPRKKRKFIVPDDKEFLRRKMNFPFDF